MPIQRSGFGAKTAKSIGSTSAGRQNVADRGKGADSVIRSIAGADTAVWLDADDVAASDGDALASWSAKLGTAPAQSTAAKKPTFKATGFNNRPSVLFASASNAVHDCLAWTANQINGSSTEVCTIASVGNTSQTGKNSVIFEAGAAYWAGQYAAQFYNTTEDAVSAEGPGGAEGTVTAATVKDNIFISCFDRGESPDAIVPYINSEPASVESETSANNTNDFLWNTGANLGARNNGADLPLAGDIREFLIINRFLESGEAFRLGKALMVNSGITEMYVA